MLSRYRKVKHILRKREPKRFPKHKLKPKKKQLKTDENLPVPHTPPSSPIEIHTPPAPHIDPPQTYPPDEHGRMAPINRPPSTWRESYKEWVKRIKEWFSPNPKPPPNEEGSMDNTGSYEPSTSEDSEKRFPTHNMMKANVLKGSTNNLQWTIPLPPSKVENDHYTTSQRDYNVSPIFEMLSRYPPSRPHKNKRKHKKKRKLKHKKKQPNTENLPISHAPPSPIELPTPPAPHTDPSDEPRRVGPIDRPPSTWRKSYKEWVEWIKRWFNPNLEPPPNEEGSMDNTRSYYQPSSFEESGENHEDRNLVWHYKMNSPSDIHWRTTHPSPTKISPWTQGGSMSYFGDNDHKEKLN
ncbi:hypothetical protein PIB30_057688 [Stylosanthes scabra]|uniref:Uncharacterized protein n=1 Tax=Stylosanthes scabra TaxID=79078 RepID=A0ABU6TL31_9FABA|nr:hypothetical protein [Stylosanthes scabra]